MLKIEDDFLLLKYKAGMDLQRGDRIVSSNTSVEFEVKKVEKVGQKFKFRTLHAMKMGVPEKKVFVFKMDLVGENSLKSLDLARWIVKVKRDAPCVGPQYDASLYFGRYRQGSSFALLCQCEEEEGPPALSLQEARNLASSQGWRLKNAWIDQASHLVERWNCPVCENKKWGSLVIPKIPLTQKLKGTTDKKEE